MDGARRIQIKAIVEHFRGKAVSNGALKEFCERNKYEPLSEGDYQDWLFQYEHDERVKAALPAIFAELSKFQYVPELCGDIERQAISKANGEIEVRIAELMEEHGVLYNEIEVFTKNLGSAFMALMENAGTRASNTCAAAVSTLAKKTFGELLTLKKLSDYHRNQAK